MCAGKVLTPILDNVWGAERPFMWNRIDVGGRSAVIRLSDGKHHKPMRMSRKSDATASMPQHCCNLSRDGAQMFSGDSFDCQTACIVVQGPCGHSRQWS
jgi:hypothetical protein